MSFSTRALIVFGSFTLMASMQTSYTFFRASGYREIPSRNNKEVGFLQSYDICLEMTVSCPTHIQLESAFLHLGRGSQMSVWQAAVLALSVASSLCRALPTGTEVLLYTTWPTVCFPLLWQHLQLGEVHPNPTHKPPSSAVPAGHCN